MTTPHTPQAVDSAPGPIAPGQELIDTIRGMTDRNPSDWSTAELRAAHGFALLVVDASEASRLALAEPESPADVERLIDAADQHGVDSEPAHEVGDLQAYLRAAWSVMTQSQKTAVFLLPSVQETYEAGTLNELTLEDQRKKRTLKP